MHNYISNHPNKELRQYFNILCNNEYPDFIDKYINSKELQRLSGVGQFCGVDYNNIKCHSTKYWYSRLDHSVACALIVWHFTKDKTQTVAALFHDMGTPAFAHSVDYMYGDYIKQKSAERSTHDMIKDSSDIKKMFESDNVLYDDVINIEKFTIVENERPKICVDRLEGVLHTGLIWGHYWSIHDIKRIYKSVSILKDCDNLDEIGFDDLITCDYFFKGAFKYSMLLQLNEDKLSMQLTGDILRMLIDYEIINEEDLYRLSEQEIIKRIKTSDDEIIKYVWSKFEKLHKVERTNVEPVDRYYISIDCKKRYVNPLVNVNGNNIRLTNISSKASHLQKTYTNFRDENYAFIDLEPIKKLEKRREVKSDISKKNSK
ncbi:MAG: hypothetical protein ACM3O4_06365 [Ignavibacteriales bacterium]